MTYIGSFLATHSEPQPFPSPTIVCLVQAVKGTYKASCFSGIFYCCNVRSPLCSISLLMCAFLSAAHPCLQRVLLSAHAKLHAMQPPVHIYLSKRLNRTPPHPHAVGSLLLTKYALVLKVLQRQEEASPSLPQ